MRASGLLTTCSTLVIALIAVLGCGNSKPKTALPESQAQFLAAVDRYATEYAKQDNELRMSAVARQRQETVAEIVPDGIMREWVGTLDQLGTTGEGKAYLSIRLSGRTSAKTWNNGVSDLMHETLIDPESPLYDRLSELKEGDEVVFTGQVLGEGSVTESGAMEEPELIVRFADIHRPGTPGIELASAPSDAPSDATSGAVQAQASADWDEALPSVQRSYLEVLDRYAKEYAQQPNELKKSTVKRARQAELAKLLPGGEVEDWIGVLDRMSTTSDGHAYIEVRLSDRTSAKTWNNALSDMGDKTLIRSGSPLYERLAELETGTPVVFSGRIIREASLTEEGSMDLPELLVRFSDLRVLTDSSGAPLVAALAPRPSTPGAELERLSRQLGGTGGMPDAEALQAQAEELNAQLARQLDALHPGGSIPRPSTEKVAAKTSPARASTKPAATSPRQRASAPAQPEKTLSCSERRELWQQQGKPEWLIRESLQSLGCPGA